MTAVVAHLGGQHALRLAENLHAGGMLQCLATGVVFRSPPRWMHVTAVKGVRARYSPALRGARSIMMPYLALADFAARKLIPAEWRLSASHGVLHSFDRLVAKRLENIGGRVIVAYENSALNTFQAARELGMVCVLDAASVHYRSQQFHGLDRNQSEVLNRINAWKHRELELADVVITASRFARDSYVKGGVAPHKMRIVPMGVDCESFFPGATGKVSDEMTFLFAGSISAGKGVDVLCSAFAEMGDRKAKLRLAGPCVDPSMLQHLKGTAVEYIGELSPLRLAEEYRRADVFVLPSRFDGYGMAVLEAMASARSEERRVGKECRL